MKLTGPPEFLCQELTVGCEHLEFHYRNIIECIWALFGNPEFARDLVFAPEQHYTDSTKTCCVYDEMHTGDWWWSVQVRIWFYFKIILTGDTRRPWRHIVKVPPLFRIVPVIISSDKMQLTDFRGKTAYPMYMTIGNIPKDICRKPSRSAQMLIGYNPTSKLEGITNKAARRRALANLFHSCMEKVLDPIRLHGETGLMMMTGDGTWHRCHPILATFIGDYPEQTLVTCTFNGRCPKCLVPHNQLGEYTHFPPRDHAEAIDTYLLADEDMTFFHAACRSAGLKPVFHPFWRSLPLTNIFISVTPDVLHQLLQGVLKHILSWITHPAVFGGAVIDARCRSVPPNHHITIFAKGITSLSRVTGKEHKAMCGFLMGLITDLPLQGGQTSSRVVKAVRAILDFIYLAQFPSQTTDTLNRLEASLSRFHENKGVFLDLELRTQFKIPKIHSLLHYKSSITLFGTTDDYNTENSERLHIEFTKLAYDATNGKDELPQMTSWLRRREKVVLHTAFIKWQRHNTATRAPVRVPLGPPQAQVRYPKMTLHPTVKAVSFEVLAESYGAVDFQDALADYMAQVNHPGASAATLHAQAADTLLPFRTISVFHRIKFTSTGNSDDSNIMDSAVIRPEQKDTRGRTVPSRFDTVLVRGKHQGIHGNNGEF
jgi:hypothetical protein